MPVWVLPEGMQCFLSCFYFRIVTLGEPSYELPVLGIDDGVQGVLLLKVNVVCTYN